MDVFRWLTWLVPPKPSPAPRAPAPTPAWDVELSDAPDTPQSFGFTTKWFAARDISTQALFAALALEDARPANWNSGIAAAREIIPPYRVFVTPPVQGWTLVVGHGLPYPTDIADWNDTRTLVGAPFDEMFARLVQLSPEVCFFGTHRGVSFDAWAKASHGVVTRVFCYGEAEVYANRGAQTEEERMLGLPDLGDRDPGEADEYLYELNEMRDAKLEELLASDMERARAERIAGRRPYPEETDTLNLAALWSVPPFALDQIDSTLGVGLVGVLPKPSRGS